MTNRCAWCNRSDVPLESLTINEVGRLGERKGPGTVLVHPEHAQNFARYSAAAHRRGRAFLLVLACVLVSIVVFNFLLIWNLTWGLLGIGAAVVVFGCTLFVWPFVTPETVSLLGAKRGIAVARGASVLIVIIGMWLLWLALRS